MVKSGKRVSGPIQASLSGLITWPRTAPSTALVSPTSSQKFRADTCMRGSSGLIIDNTQDKTDSINKLSD